MYNRNLIVGTRMSFFSDDLYPVVLEIDGIRCIRVPYGSKVILYSETQCVRTE